MFGGSVVGGFGGDEVVDLSVVVVGGCVACLGYCCYEDVDGGLACVCCCCRGGGDGGGSG